MSVEGYEYWGDAQFSVGTCRIAQCFSEINRPIMFLAYLW